MGLMYLAALTAITAGCTKEDRDVCEGKAPETTSLTFTVKAYHNTGTELTKEDVSHVMLYVFDHGLHFLKNVDAVVGEPVTIEVPAGEDAHVIAWGNLGDEMQKCTDPTVGTHIGDFCVDLVEHTFTRAPSPVRSPDDLFRGQVTAYSEQHEQGEFTIPIVREVGSMTVTIRGLRRYAGFNDENYSIVVHGLSSSIDFLGNQTGDPTNYHPTGSFGGNGVAGEYYVPVFNLLPSSGMQIDIYHDTELIESVTTDSSGKYIHVGQGIQTNILIDFGIGGDASLNVRLSITDWGNDELWKVF